MITVNNLKHTPIGLLLLICYCGVFSQNDQPRVKYFTLEDGISQVSSNDLLLDSSGFIWIATQDGLNKFDGNKFIHFKYNKQDSLTLSGNLINKLLEDSTGKIWVGTISSGLNYYNPELEIFHRIKLKKSSDDNEIITALEEDQQNNIWVGSRLSGLHKLSYSNNGGLLQEAFLKEQAITGALIDEENTLWVGDNKGAIYQIDPSSTKTPDSTPIAKVQGNVQAFYRTTNHLLIGGDFGFHIYDIANQQTELFELSGREELSSKHVLVFLKNDEQSVWIGTGNGIYLFDWVNRRILNKILYSEDKTNGLSNGTVQALLQISKNQMLVGTANYPNLIDLAEPHFKNISKNQRGDHLLNDNVIFSIFKEDDDLWIGTSDGGLNLIRKGIPYYFKYNPNTPNGISGTVVRAIVKDDINNRLWLATTRGLNMIDLKTFDPNNAKFSIFKHDPKNPNSINGDFLKDIILDTNNNLWGATYGHGVFRMEYSSDKDYKIIRYKNSPKNQNSLNNDYTDCIRADKENNIWVGTQSGLSILSYGTTYEKPVFNNFSKIEGNESSLVHNSVYDIVIDKKNRIWLGTRGGFSQYLGNGKFKSWTQQKQFSNDVVYSIQDDLNGNLWMGTNEGIVKYNPDDNTFKQFNIEDGIQSKEFDIHARFTDDDGLIYLGGIGGVTYFHPDDLEQIDQPQSLYFSDLQVKGNPVKVNKESKSILKQPIKTTEHLKFKHNEFPFFLQFSSIDYRINKNVEYAYKLLPTDTEWIFLKDPEIQFLNLPSGDYTLQVNGFSRGEEWEQAPLEMKLGVLPPWWATWWAYLIYAGIAVGIADRFYRFQLSKKLAVSESARLKEVSALKSGLYTNITHEFRTPLTVILGMTQNLRKNLKSTISVSDENSLSMIQRNGESLLEMVNEMLDLAKIESGSMELNLLQIDVIPFVKYVSESFHSLAEAKKVHLTIYSEIDTLEMDIDVNKVASIISNLLSNAIKFTSAAGKVIVHLNKIKLEETQFLVIKVQDNGLGLAEEDIVHLFDRFYQVNSTSTKQEGTGIGLSLTREFVKLMKGTIAVESTLGKGSTFTVQIPITNTSIKTEEAKITVAPSIKASVTAIKKEPLFEKDASELPLVLIIEDNMDVAHYLETCLKGNYQTLHASNGNMGIEMAYEKIPDIIISDVMMPGKDGYEVCAALKADERTDHIPIIILTAKVTTEDRLTGLTHGADAYLAKPFNERELFIRLNQLVLVRKKLIDKIQKDGLNKVMDKRAESPETKFLQKVIQFINEDISNSAFGSGDLADKLHLSESQIYRKLKAITDKSIAVFIRSIRLQKAKELIETTDKTISEIAYETGFNDPSWFSRAFKEEFGFAPSDSHK